MTLLECLTGGFSTVVELLVVVDNVYKFNDIFVSLIFDGRQTLLSCLSAIDQCISCIVSHPYIFYLV